MSNQHTNHSISNPTTPKSVKFYIEEQPLTRIKAFAQVADRNEIGGFGFVRMENKVPVVYDVMLPEQKVSSGGIDLTPMDAMDFADEHGYPIEEMRFSWHTHGRGTTFWSSTDHKWVHRLGYENGIPWLISLVTNSSFTEYRARFDIFEPIRLFVDEIKMMELMSDLDIEEALAEANEKVTVKPIVVVRAVTKGEKETDSKELTKAPAYASRDDEIRRGLIIADGADIDRDDISEDQAARMLADVGLSPEDVTIIGDVDIETNGGRQASEDEDDVESYLHDAAAQQVDRVREGLGYDHETMKEGDIVLLDVELQEVEDGN